MKKLDFDTLENVKGGKFFGTETEYGPCQSTGGNSGGIRYVTETFYAFWGSQSKKQLTLYTANEYFIRYNIKKGAYFYALLCIF